MFAVLICLICLFIIIGASWFVLFVLAVSYYVLLLL